MILVQTKNAWKQGFADEMQKVRTQLAQGPLSVEDFDKAEAVIVHFFQTKQFPDEMMSLRKG